MLLHKFWKSRMNSLIHADSAPSVICSVSEPSSTSLSLMKTFSQDPIHKSSRKITSASSTSLMTWKRKCRLLNLSFWLACLTQTQKLESHPHKRWITTISKSFLSLVSPSANKITTKTSQSFHQKAARSMEDRTRMENRKKLSPKLSVSSEKVCLTDLIIFLLVL